MSAQPLSVVIITYNEADKIKACLDSVAFADECVVVDSQSSDHTQAIARAQGAKVIEQPWLGYGQQKQFAVQQAGHDWVLCLDADERPSPRLIESIQTVLQSPTYKAYQMPRCNYFINRWLRFGEGYPDWSLRLFDRNYAHWRSDPVHEAVITEQAVGRLAGDLLHYSADSLSQYLAKQNRYTSLQAEQLFAANEHSSLGRMLTSPLLRFIKFYLIRQGFRDGLPGLIHILIGCHNSFYKYAKLKALQLTHNDDACL